MKITIDHPASECGCPVILDDDGAVLDNADGIRAIRRVLNLSVEQIALATGKSKRTVEGWHQGRQIPPESLNLLGRLLSAHRTGRKKCYNKDWRFKP